MNLEQEYKIATSGLEKFKVLLDEHINEYLLIEKNRKWITTDAQGVKKLMTYTSEGNILDCKDTDYSYDFESYGINLTAQLHYSGCSSDEDSCIIPTELITCENYEVYKANLKYNIECSNAKLENEIDKFKEIKNLKTESEAKEKRKAEYEKLKAEFE